MRLSPVSTQLLPVERLPWTHSLEGRLAKATRQSASGMGVGTRGQVSSDPHRCAVPREHSCPSTQSSGTKLSAQTDKEWECVFSEIFNSRIVVNVALFQKKNPGLFSSASWGKIDAYCAQQLGWERELAVAGGSSQVLAQALSPASRFYWI